jgi:hypothetical protein
MPIDIFGLKKMTRLINLDKSLYKKNSHSINVPINYFFIVTGSVNISFVVTPTTSSFL